MTLETTGTETLVRLPVQQPETRREGSALIARLVDDFGATWVDDQSIDAWSAQGGDRVVLFAGDPVRFPEGQDVAAVLPELMRSFPGRFAVAVVPRDLEDKVARRFGSQRWPTLLFLRDGGYVGTVPGMHDWDVFLQRVEAALASPVGRAPTIGIPVVSATGAANACH
ncbi:hydrogenase [Variovorax paradoxus]|jgi:hydrogenase-1 operon protein HyaE|uniref:Hydrogenase-1 operon protein HyaE n=1 Tax=Variovorax paradoxus TaxID=34073 RepID=A0AAW8EH28_VARPD|nr:hydrogenase [Variovorax paradoxus]MDP9972150.1 hydrogenase-1 operon protein HyaE [Variovorax paradoxus]